MKLRVKRINNSFWFSVIYKGASIIIGTASSRKEALDVVFNTIEANIKLIKNLEVA